LFKVFHLQLGLISLQRKIDVVWCFDLIHCSPTW